MIPKPLKLQLRRLTGHFVLSTIHTNSAPATITRLIDMGVEPFLIASSLICVVSQRLLDDFVKNVNKNMIPPVEMFAVLD